MQQQGADVLFARSHCLPLREEGIPRVDGTFPDVPVAVSQASRMTLFKEAEGE